MFANRKKDRAQSALGPWYDGAADDAKGTPAAGTGIFVLAGAAADTQAGAAVVVACTAVDMAADMLLVEFVTRTHHALAPGTEEAHILAAADTPAGIDEAGFAAAAAAVVAAGNKAAAAAVVPTARKAAAAAATDTAVVAAAAAAVTCTAAAAAFAVSGTGAVAAAATETGTVPIETCINGYLIASARSRKKYHSTLLSTVRTLNS